MLCHHLLSPDAVGCHLGGVGHEVTYRWEHIWTLWVLPRPRSGETCTELPSFLLTSLAICMQLDFLI